MTESREQNPFTPSFGVSPPELVGRNDIHDRFEAAITQGGVGAMEFVQLVSGQRGTGKTVTLNLVEDIARAHGFVVISEIATPGVLQRLVTEELPRQLRELDPGATRWNLKSAGAMGVSAGWEAKEQYPYTPGLRSLLEDLIRLATERDGGAGVVLTIDEVHGRAAREDLRTIGGVYQLLRRQNLRIAFAGAGLPHGVNDLLTDEVLTFLRRGVHYVLAGVAPVEAEYAIEQPLRESRREMTGEALRHVVNASRGYPFLIQLIGSELWRHSKPGDVIELAVARRAVAFAIPRLRDNVHAPLLRDIGGQARAYLAAMAQDDGPARQRDIAARMGVDANTASTYRTRLIAAETIAPAGRGYVDFSVPYLRETIRELLGIDPRVEEQGAPDHAIEAPQRIDPRHPPDIS